MYTRACPPLTPAELKRRLGALWHDLAYGCLLEDDGRGARQAALRSAARLPLKLKNYIYFLLGATPPLRKRWLARRRPATSDDPESCLRNPRGRPPIDD